LRAASTSRPRPDLLEPVEEEEEEEEEGSSVKPPAASLKAELLSDCAEEKPRWLDPDMVR
jgi:hypothetical protein